MKRHAFLGAVMALGVMAGCGEDTAGPGIDMQASVEGRVDQTSPPPSSPARSGPQQVAGASAETVAVVQVQADGSFLELATAEVGAGGRFTVEGVPAGRSDLAVVAYGGGSEVGGVLIHEESRAGATIVVAPINQETTLEVRSYSAFRASSGGSANTGSELSLFVHGDAGATDIASSSQSEIDAVATAYANASATATAAYQARGVALDARTRAEIMADAAVDFAINRDNGMSVDAAHELFTEAALDAIVDARADIEATVLATAASATRFDAALNGTSSVRGDLVVQPLLLNLKARKRLAASHASSAEASVAAAVHGVLADAEASLRFAVGLIDIRALIDGTLSAVVDAGADACVELLAAGASSTVQANVRTAAEVAIETARLGVQLQGTTSAGAAAAVLADYRAGVRAAVDAMIEASGGTAADAEVLTEVFIAASAGAYIAS